MLMNFSILYNRKFRNNIHGWWKITSWSKRRKARKKQHIPLGRVFLLGQDSVMVNLIASTQVSKLQKREAISDNKVVICTDWQSSYCGRHTGMPCFMLSAQSAAKSTVKKLGGEGGVYFISIWLHSPRDGQRDDTAQGGQGCSSRVRTGSGSCPGHSNSPLPSPWCEAEPQGEPLPTSHRVSGPCHSTLPSCQTLGWCAREWYSSSLLLCRVWPGWE